MSIVNDFEIVLPSFIDRNRTNALESPSMFYYFGFDTTQLVVHKSRGYYQVLSRGYRPHHLFTDNLVRNSFCKYSGKDFLAAKTAFRNLVLERLHDVPVFDSGLEPVVTV